MWGQCNEGHTEIDGDCYYQSDLDVLQIFIDNSDSTINMDMDVDSSGVIEPLELGDQNWNDGRLNNLDCGWFIECGLSNEIPVNIGDLIDSIIFDDQITDISYGRNPDGNSEWFYFSEPTPLDSNLTVGYGDTIRTSPPQFLPEGGFFASSQSIELITDIASAIIRFTLDGSKPNVSPRLLRAGHHYLLCYH